ncbi:hypothetical protein GCM10010095_84970 [Streptomyces anthocyanicus]|nr:hypothetical protein GCM10010095_84970 [Streptomyces anthocyanicus]
MIVLKGLMNWDFFIWLGYFGVSGLFMMKSMSFKRMIWSFCRVELCSIRDEIGFLKNKVFLE